MRFLEESLIQLDVDASTPEQAIQQAGELLVQANLVEHSYVEAMVQSFHKNGAYFVLAPHIALPHARPEDGVKEACVSLIRLRDELSFGHTSNDPVKLVFALGASTSDQHLLVLQKLMTLLGDKKNITQLLEATNQAELRTIVRGKD